MGTPYQPFALVPTGGGGTGAGGSTPWIVTSEDRAKNDRIFQSLGPINGKITGQQAKSYLMSSGLSPTILAQIWTLSDMDGDGKMTAHEFSIAMKLIQCRRQGLQLPGQLPPTMRAPAPQSSSFAPQPMVMGGMGVGLGPVPLYGGTLPARHHITSSPGLRRASSFQQPKTLSSQQQQDAPWAVSAAAKMKYNQIFNANDRLRSGYLTGAQARTLLMQTGLPQDRLAQIWHLADINNDGRLSNEEFAVAMYLVDDVKAGSTLPIVLPMELVPPSMRRKAAVAATAAPTAVQRQQQPPQQLQQTKHLSSSGDLMTGKKDEAVFPLHTQTYEDRKRENFERGRLELEKRKQERREKERKEKEEKERKLREEMEKREKEQEQERRKAEERRLAELEEERQRELERQKLEADHDYQATLQRQSAQREMELAREREWQKRRKEELEISKSKLAGEVGALKQKWRSLNVELEALTHRQTSILGTLESNRLQMDEGRRALHRISQSRDSRTEELNRLQGELKNASDRLSFLTEARERVAEDLKMKGFISDASMISQSAKDQCQQKRTAIIQLRVLLQQQNDMIAEKTRESMAHHLQLKELVENEEKLSIEVTGQRQLVDKKQRERDAEMRQKAAETKRRDDEAKQRREEAERQRREAEETARREEDERKRREDEARRRAAEQREAMLKETEERERRDEERARQAEEARKRQIASAERAKEAVETTHVEIRRAESLSPPRDAKMSVAEKAYLRRSELDDDADRRSAMLEERLSKAGMIRQQVEMLQKKKKQIQQFKVQQKQEAAAKAAEEARRRKVSEETTAKAAERKRIEDERRRKEEERKAAAAAEEARQRAAAAKEARQKAEAAAAAAAAAAKEEAMKKEEEEAELKKRQIEARKQALVAKKEKLLAEKKQASIVREEVRPHYRALYDFVPRGKEELEFKEGDVIISVPTSTHVDAGWFRGELNGRVGLVPLNYVTEIDQRASPASQRRAVNLARSSSPSHPVPVPRSKTPPRQTSPLAAADSIYSVPPSRFRRRETSPLSIGGEASLAGRRSKTFSSAPCSPTSKSPPSSFDDAPDSGRRLERQESDHFRVVALYAYSGRDADHLTFNKDDIISVLDQNDMWYKGSLRGKQGWFPKSYVKLIGGRRAQSSSALPDASTKSEAIAIATIESVEEEAPPEEYVAIYNYSGDDRDLSFKTNDVILVTKKDDDWWTGKIGSREGTFPATYVKKKVNENEAKGKQTDVKVAPSTLKRPLIATVVAKYEATGPEQLSLMQGQLVHVRKQNPNGWWEGELQARGKKKKGGWFPSNRVKLLGNPNETPVARRGTDLRQASADEIQPGTPPSSTSISSSSSSSTTPSASSQPPAPPTPGDFRVVAVFSYQANNDDELSFTKGSVILVTSREGEWWTGDLNGQIGVFPSNYVQPVSELHTPATAKWSDTIEPLVLESLDDTERKRQEAIFELIQTEQSYCDALHLVKNLFYDPVNEGNILEPEVIQGIFVNWNELITFSDYFLKMLRVRQKNHETEPIDCVGDILCEQVPRLTSFIRFCSRQMNAISLLQSKASKSDAFKELEAKIAQDSQTGGLPLSSFLLRPMQRVTKYPLLISKILQYTAEGHSDHGALSDAVKLAEDLCSQVNEGVRMQENSDRLEWLQNNVNISSLEERVVFNSQTNRVGLRRFLHSGNLKKARSGRELFVVLFNDFLMFMKPVTKLSAMFDSSDYKYEVYRKPVFLDQVQVEVAPAEQYGDDCSFHIGVAPEKIMFVKAENHTERNAWVKKITTAVQFYKQTIRTKYRQERDAIEKEKARPSVGTLSLLVAEAANLQPSDPNGKSDPFCEVRMGTQVHRTQVIEKSLNPKWNTRMIFYLKDLRKDRLCFTVFDRDLFSPSDYLGRTELPVAELVRDSTRGSFGKWLVLKEVSTGEIHVKLVLKLPPRPKAQ